jgi:integrase
VHLLGSNPHLLTLDQARKKALRYLGQAADNADPQRQSDADSASVTVAELVSQYVEKHAKSKKLSWKRDQNMLRAHLASCETRPVISVTTAQIEQLHAAHNVDFPYAANDLVSIVRKKYNWGRVAGLVPKDMPNPGVGIVRFPSRRRRRFVTTVEMPRLLTALEQEDNEFARHAIWLLLLIGLRKNELLRAKWKDVDWDFQTLFIGLTKNGEPVLAPLSNAAIDRLRLIPRIADNEHIICGHKSGCHLTYLSSAWRRVRKAADLQDLRLHDLRRTVGSWLVQHGESLHLVGAVLNHKDAKTTAGYAYFQTQQRSRALTAHGENVLAFAPALLNRSERAAEPQYSAVLTHNPLTPEAPAARGVHYVAREYLHQLVWESPVSEVAARFGVSDVGLAKAFRRSAIPIPPRGYWAKLEAGKWIDPAPLPAAPSKYLGKIRIKSRSPQDLAPSVDSTSRVAA